MQLDIEDVLSGVFGRISSHALYLLSAIWIGSMIGGSAILAGEWLYSPRSFHGLGWVWVSPYLLFNMGIVLNAAFLGFITIYVMHSDNSGFAVWGVVVGVESLFAMFGINFHPLPALYQVASWGAWLVLLTMAETGVWLIRNARMNRWAREMMELSAENALRRAERESRSHEPEENTGLK